MDIIKKYELIGEATYFWGKPLYRIVALCNINDTSVKAGDLGGWVASEDNLSHSGACWVYDEAKVFDNCRVEECASIKDFARLYDNVVIGDYSTVCDGATVSGSVGIFGYATVSGNCKVIDFAIVRDFATVSERSEVGGNATVSSYAEVIGSATVGGNATIGGRATICDKAIIYGNVFVEGCSVVCSDAIIYGDTSIDDFAFVGGKVKIGADISIRNNAVIESSADYFLFTIPNYTCIYNNIFAIYKTCDSYSITGCGLEGDIDLIRNMILTNNENAVEFYDEALLPTLSLFVSKLSYI